MDNSINLNEILTNTTLPKINENENIIYEIPIYDTESTNNYINKIIININLLNIKKLNNYPLNIYINI